MNYVVIDSADGSIVGECADKSTAWREARQLNEWYGARGRFSAIAAPRGSLVRIVTQRRNRGMPWAITS